MNLIICVPSNAEKGRDPSNFLHRRRDPSNFLHRRREDYDDDTSNFLHSMKALDTVLKKYVGNREEGHLRNREDGDPSNSLHSPDTVLPKDLEIHEAVGEFPHNQTRAYILDQISRLERKMNSPTTSTDSFDAAKLELDERIKQLDGVEPYGPSSNL